MLTLILKEGAEPRTLQLSQDLITIGRSKENTITIRNIKASRLHAKIEQIGGTYQITDCGSGNGTRVNGEKIDFHLLEAGDEIKIGDATLTLKSIDEEAAEGIDPETDTPVGDEIKIEIQDDDKIDIMDDERETELSVKAAPPPPKKPSPAPVPKAAPAPAPKAAAPAKPAAAEAPKGKPVIAPKARPSLADRFKKKKD